MLGLRFFVSVTTCTALYVTSPLTRRTEPPSKKKVAVLDVECVERKIQYGTLFIFKFGLTCTALCVASPLIRRTEPPSKNKVAVLDVECAERRIEYVSYSYLTLG